MADKSTEMRNTAGNYFKEGYNCAESIIKTFRPLVAPEFDESILRMFSGYGGGYGHAGCSCGALASSIAVIGMLKGRESAQGDRDTIYDLARQFHDRFEDRFGATCCRILNPHPYDSIEHLKNCLKITGNTAKMLYDYLTDKKLI
ncbi:MAG: C-GCAxxG-C-C family protein [Clostridiales bacterium]|nr:C-GCAxxG-C-C family protein [Clostridiales bacterium]MCF8022626.1 C-GCAxxG-C-C family protein [Clostridiales bacterium]